MPNCTKPPHFPPGCGCPPGSYTASGGQVTKQRPLSVEEAERALYAYTATWPTLAEFRDKVRASN